MSYAQKTLLNKQLPSYAGFLVLLVALGITLLLSGNTLIFISKATVGSNPKDIQISNVTATSFTISYTTDTNIVGTLSYGTDSSTPNIALDDRDQKASGAEAHQIHFITVKNLSPSTKYYYIIDSGSQKTENNGVPFEITTQQKEQNQAAILPTLSGTTALSDGSVPSEGIIFVSTGNSQQLAALISPDGNYQISLNGLQSNSSSVAVTQDTVLQLEVVTPALTSSVKVLESQAMHVPKIILSQNYDFTLGTVSLATGSAQLASGSGFPVLATPAPVSSPEITTPTDAQAFKDQKPLFQGRALPNTEVDITIQSQQEISAKLQSDTNGAWQFRPPVTLAPGKHTITIQSIDASGIIQTISRSFVVYASGSQFVEPSVSPVAVTPAPTAIPTIAPAPTALPTPTVAPTIVVTPTNALTPAPSKAPVPKTGSSALVTGTVTGIAILGIGALLFFLTVV